MLRGDASLQPVPEPEPQETGTPEEACRAKSPPSPAARGKSIGSISATDARQSSVAVITIDGDGRSARRTLAVHLAHQLIDRSPDR